MEKNFIKILLSSGIAASILYVGMTFLGAMQWPNYSHFSQTVSELFAIDAPSQSLVVSLMLAYSALMVAFAVGVWKSAGGRLALYIVAALLIAKEILGAIATIYAPMRLRGVEGSQTDVAHAVITMIGVLLLLLTVGLGQHPLENGSADIQLSLLLYCVCLVFWQGWMGHGLPKISQRRFLGSGSVLTFSAIYYGWQLWQLLF